MYGVILEQILLVVKSVKADFKVKKVGKISSTVEPLQTGTPPIGNPSELNDFVSPEFLSCYSTPPNRKLL